MISIIIPVFNDFSYLKKTLEAISSQSLRDDEVEILVVDNGSTNQIPSSLNSQKNITVLQENRHLNSPYSCRNRGIEVAKGNVIILLDATCTPSKDWLVNGLEYLERTGADIVGGNVLFDFEGNLTGAKIYDSITNIKMRESIEKGVAKTANLFVRKEVFDKIGLFPEGVRSGADVRWTYKATSKGLRLMFCEDAVVYKPARDFRELVKKQWRVGLHQPLIWKDLGRKSSIKDALKKIVLPVSPRAIRTTLNKQGSKEMRSYFLTVWFTAQVIKTTMGVANFKGILKIKSAK